MQPHAPTERYQRERDTQNTYLHTLLKKRNRFGWLRLALIILTIILAIQAFSVAVILGIFCLVAGIAAFLIVVSIDVTNNSRIAHTQKLLSINEEELQVLQGNYKQRFAGEAFAPGHHAYAGDLDLFGTASLYQYINRCTSEQGRHKLAQNFLSPLSVENIKDRQTAVIEIAPLLQWRQHFQALMVQTPVSLATQRVTQAWLAEEARHFTHKAWPGLINLYSVLTVASAIAALLGFIAPGVFSGLFVIYLIIATTLSGKATKAYTQLNGIVKEINTLQQAMQWIEEKPFKAPLLHALQQSVKTKGENGHGQIKKLKAILNRFDMRLNVYVFIFLNSFLLWDVRQMLALNKWRQQNKAQVNAWFELIAEMEVLNSLATLHFNQPQWSWPQFSPVHFTYEGAAIGHPLLEASQRITNDFILNGTAKVALITGSNMAGKSTFLRSLGVNAVLAQLGAPVCARQLLLSPVQVMSSMRIADNLAENTSTFYAELKKLKAIIEAVETGKPLFILLDEVLRGTNSLDRHIGLKALIQQLIRKNAVAVIATHDVEVAKLEEAYPNALTNYHFDVQVAGEELYFDYKLKTGVCTSLNASLLMKKIGIELEN